MWLLVLTVLSFFTVIPTAKAFSPDPALNLTAEERAWLEVNQDNITYGPNPDWPPGDYMEDGVHKGIVADYVKLFERKLDVTFKRVYFNDWKTFYDGMLSGAFDLVGATQETEERKKTHVFTKPFLHTRLAIIARIDNPPLDTLDNLNAMTVAGIAGYSSTDYVREHYPGAKIAESDDDLTMLLKVSLGAVDAAVIDYMVASYLIQKYGITNLKYAGELDFHWDLRFAIHKQKAPLAPIIDKALATISQQERERIYNKWVINIEGSPSFIERNLRNILIGIIIFSTLLVLAAVVMFNRSLQRKVSEQTRELRKAHNRLEEQVRVRTRELETAKREAEKADAAKSDFLASMSHELRTPLNAIMGYAQVLKILPDAPLSGKQSEYVDNIVSGGDHLLELVNDILDLARIESDRLSITLEDTPLEPILADTLSHLELDCKDRGIRILNELNGHDFPLVLTDRVRCKQILTNLLSNAVKFSSPGGRIWVKGEVSADDYLRVTIVDEGIGIPAEKHDAVFQLFNRAVRDPMKSASGSGVGLAVSKMLTERLGGRIGFKSVEGEGSVFWFELPLTSNDKVLIWTDDYRVGVDAIDKDHQVIFRLTNKVIEHDLEEADLLEVIAEMIDYTSYHFRREEAIMEVCGYPDLDAHCHKHHLLEAHIQDLRQAWKETEDPALLQRLRTFLRSWWSGHIMNVDKTIAEHAKGHEARILKKLAEFSVK